MIAMRDGTRLYTAIYSPADTLPHPVLLLRTPYPLHPYGKGFAQSLRGAEAVFVREIENIFTERVPVSDVGAVYVMKQHVCYAQDVGALLLLNTMN